VEKIIRIIIIKKIDKKLINKKKENEKIE